MIRYVAIGAVVGFLVAYFLLSQGSEESSPPVEAPAQGLAAPPTPLRPRAEELMRLQPLQEPAGVRGPAVAVDAGT
jgi:hypothetical protein